MRDMIWKVWRNYQRGKTRGELDVREQRLMRGEFGPVMPIYEPTVTYRTLPRPFIKRAVYEAAVKEVCYDIEEGNIPPGQLIGLAQMLGLDFDDTITWNELCTGMRREIRKMLL